MLHATESAQPENPLQLVVDLRSPRITATTRRSFKSVSHLCTRRRRIRRSCTPTVPTAARTTNDSWRSTTSSTFRPGSVAAPLRRRWRSRVCRRGASRCAALRAMWWRARRPGAGTGGIPGRVVCQLPPGVGLSGEASQGWRQDLLFRRSRCLRQAAHRRLLELPPERPTLHANIEATMKEFKAPTRNGKLRTRRRAAATQYAFSRAIMINFGRIYRYLAGQSPTNKPDPAQHPSPISGPGRFWCRGPFASSWHAVIGRMRLSRRYGRAVRTPAPPETE